MIRGGLRRFGSRRRRSSAATSDANATHVPTSGGRKSIPVDRRLAVLITGGSTPAAPGLEDGFPCSDDHLGRPTEPVAGRRRNVGDSSASGGVGSSTATVLDAGRTGRRPTSGATVPASTSCTPPTTGGVATATSAIRPDLAGAVESFAAELADTAVATRPGPAAAETTVVVRTVAGFADAGVTAGADADCGCCSDFGSDCAPDDVDVSAPV
jgi:hypothetical protein